MQSPSQFIRRLNRFSVINGLIIIGTAIYLATYVISFLLEGRLPDDGYWLVLLAVVALFGVLQLIANRGHLLLAGRLWVILFGGLAVVQMVPFITTYDVIFFLSMQLLIIGAGSFAGRGWGYMSAVGVTLIELLVVSQFALEFSMGALTAVIICNAVIAAVVEHSEVDRRDLAETSQTMRTVLNASPAAMLLLNEKNHWEMANPRLWELYPEASRHRWADPAQFVNPAHHNRLHDALDDARRNQQTQRLHSTRVTTDCTQDLDIQLVPFGDEGKVLMMVTDVTALRETERMKDAMIATVTHELRTPLTSLRLYHTLLGKRPDKHEQYIANLERETLRLQHIIDQMLDMARLEQGSVQPVFETHDLVRLVQEFVTDREVLVTRQALSLTVDSGPLMARVDRLMMDQALGVLLNNAINYTPPDGRIMITVGQADANEALIIVADTGPGISRGDRAHIFKRFYRGQAAAQTGKPGTGLGLPIAKDVIERHGGRISVESGAGEGTRFIITIPLIASDKKEAAPSNVGAASR